MNDTGLLLWGCFFFVVFFITQKIYTFKFGWLLTIAFTTIIIAVIAFNTTLIGSSKNKAVHLFLAFPSYSILLIVIKACYNKTNNYLVKKRILKEKYFGKEFTFTTATESGSDVWNARKATAPSWLDRLLSISLLLIPLLIVYWSLD